MAWELPIEQPAELDPQSLDVSGTGGAPPAAPLAAPAGQIPAPPIPSADLVGMPDISGVLGPRPSVPMPAPPMPPTGQMDARQQLLHAIAAGVMLGMGPRNGASVGVGQGVQQMDALARQREQQQFAYQQQDYVRKQGQAAATQKELDALMAKREDQLKQTLLAFKKDVAPLTKIADYNTLVQRYSSALQAAGYRISPQWFYENMKFVPPDDQKALQMSMDRVIARNKAASGTPEMLFASNVSYDSPTSGQTVTMPFLKAQAALGLEYKTDTEGNVIGLPAGKGTPYDQARTAATAEYTAQFGHPPGRGDKSANDYIAKRIGEIMGAATPERTPVSDFEQYVLRLERDRGSKMSPQEFEAARQRWTDLSRTETSNPAINLSDAGLDVAATNYAKTGQLPPMGLSKDSAGVRAKIINRAAELYPGLDVTANKAGTTANSAALTQVQKLRDSVVAFERTAGANLDRFLAAAKDVADTGLPILNQPYRRIRRQILGDPKMAAFDAARLAAVNEISRVLNTANLSGQLTDSARHEMQQALDPNATIQQLEAAAKILKADMQTRKTSYDAQIAEIQGRIRGSATTPPPPTTDDPLASAVEKLRNRAGRTNPAQ